MAESLGEGLLYATPTGVLSNPIGAFNHYKDQVTDAVHAEDWSSDRPGYGLGKILFDVGASAIPGGAAARGTKAAADAAADAVPSPGRLPDTPGGLGSFTSASQRVDDIEANLSEVGDNIPTTPMAAGPNGPAVPEALADPPSTPRSPDTIGTPRVSDSPGPNAPGLPTPHAPDSTPVDRSQAPNPSPVDRSPEPHSSTPAGIPGYGSADAGDGPRTDVPPISAAPDARGPSSADAPSAPLQSGPTSSSSSPPVSSAPPPMAGHTPELPPTATPHRETSATPSAGAVDSLDSRSDGSRPATSPGGSPNGDGSGGGAHHADRYSTDDAPDRGRSDDGGHAGDSDNQFEGQPARGDDSYSETNGVPISRETFDDILQTDKGHRPDPDTYLPPEYIAEHLKSFEDGASRIILRDSYEEYGIGKPDAGRSEYVLTMESAREIMSEANGDPVRIAQRLGIPEDQLAGDSLVLVEFHATDAYKPLMPSGNEWGANTQWLPGGKLPHGDLEAVVNTDGMVNGVDYTVIDIVAGELL